MIVYSWTALALYAVPHFIVTEAPFHNLRAALRISTAHIPPLVLLVHDLRTFQSGGEALQKFDD